MKHLSEEELVQHYYDEDGAAARIAHLTECEGCREELARLAATLDSIPSADVPERTENYGTEVWNRIRAHLPEQEKTHWFAWPRMQRWVAAGALALIVFGAFLLGRLSKPVAPAPNQNVAEQKSADKEKKILLVALGDHLDRSQMILVELAHAPRSSDVDISSEQQRAEDLIAANRLYRQAAVQSGDADVAAVLDELERVLLDVTHEPSKLDRDEMKSIQQRIESKGILFKVRVIGSKVRGDERRPEKPEPANPKVTRQTT